MPRYQVIVEIEIAIATGSQEDAEGVLHQALEAYNADHDDGTHIYDWFLRKVTELESE